MLNDWIQKYVAQQKSVNIIIDLSKLPFFEIGWPPMGPTHGHMNMSLRCHCDQIRRLSGYNNI